jgi:16S rRNA (cytidine1402-2'-O)-methyltransferase
MSAHAAPATELVQGGGLAVCPTPIGNLQDITLRVLAVLGEADVLACEDTRHTRQLLQRHGIAARELVSLHEHNEQARAAGLLERMRAGAVVALVSDAGMPLVSDPGFALVRGALAAGIAVEVLPGPSAVLVALVASGLPCERWGFVGFLPRRRSELETLLAGASETLVAFESPRRLTATLAVLAELDAQRPMAVCRELTKLHEEVRRGTAAELAEHYRAHAPRGELALVIAPPGERSAAAAAYEQALVSVQALVQAGARPRAAARVVAALTGVGANELYRGLTE